MRTNGAELVSCRNSPASSYSASEPRSVQSLRVGVPSRPQHSISNYQQVGEETKIASDERQITGLSSIAHFPGLMLG